jgi:chromatin segregation and condensation protein Rec8/ScpA/Scc1 (kleisin family)
VKFSELFAAATSRLEVVVTFLALLELIRLKHLQVFQAEPFSEIEISLPTEPALMPLTETAALPPTGNDPNLSATEAVQH